MGDGGGRCACAPVVCAPPDAVAGGAYRWLQSPGRSGSTWGRSGQGRSITGESGEPPCGRRLPRFIFLPFAVRRGSGTRYAARLQGTTHALGRATTALAFLGRRRSAGCANALEEKSRCARCRTSAATLETARASWSVRGDAGRLPNAGPGGRLGRGLPYEAVGAGCQQACVWSIKSV